MGGGACGVGAWGLIRRCNLWMLLGEGEYAESASSFTLFVFIFFCISLLKSIWHYLMEFLVYLKL